jgi:hypothetical protein
MSKTKRALFAAIVVSLAFCAMARAETQRQKAERIIGEIDDMWRGESSHGVISMRVQTRNYTRTMRMEAWSKGKDYSLVRIVLPLKEKGTATLKTKNEIYTYLPQTDRTIRLNSGMMMGSWMGSHFTNDDLVKESRLLDDYSAEVTFEGVRNGKSIIEFTLLPKPEAAVVWGKVALTVVDGKIPLKETYYDEEMQVARTLDFSAVKDLSGRTVPSVLHMTPADKPDEFTEIIYESIRFNMNLDGSLFSIASLRRK